MRRRIILAPWLICLCALSACTGDTHGNRTGEARLRRCAGAFYSAWARGDFRAAGWFLSHNFSLNDPRLSAFENTMNETGLKRFDIIDVQSELKMKRLTVELTTTDGARRTQVTYWIFEGGDWRLEVLD